MTATIQLVDDDAHNTRLVRVLLEAEGYNILVADNGPTCLQQLDTAHVDLILLDIMMPGMDGFAVAARLKAQAHTESIPIIMVTALDDREARLHALQAGAEEFLSKPVDRAELLVRVRNILRLKEYQNQLAAHNEELEARVAQRTLALRDAYRDTITTMVRAAEFKDEETGNHVHRIGYFCRDIAQQMGMNATFCDTIFYASPMHDIGKIAIPDSILLKPGTFTASEWAVMKTHAALGALILSSGGSDYTRMGAKIAQNHHERWDGSGYPQGLRGDAIPLEARLMNIADQYDALRSRRPYKAAMDHASALQVITQGDGRTRVEHFDPAVLSAFLQCAPRWQEIYAAHADLASAQVAQHAPQTEEPADTAGTMAGPG